MPQPAAKEGPRINEEIRVREVQLIDKDGANKGVTEINAALAMAQEAGLDLVEINPRYDRDGQSARWAAVLLWNFLIGLRDRGA